MPWSLLSWPGISKPPGRAPRLSNGMQPLLNDFAAPTGKPKRSKLRLGWVEHPPNRKMSLTNLLRGSMTRKSCHPSVSQNLQLPSRKPPRHSKPLSLPMSQPGQVWFPQKTWPSKASAAIAVVAADAKIVAADASPKSSSPNRGHLPYNGNHRLLPWMKLRSRDSPGSTNRCLFLAYPWKHPQKAPAHRSALVLATRAFPRAFLSWRCSFAAC